MAAIIVPPFKLSGSTIIVPRSSSVTTLRGNSGGLTIQGSSSLTDLIILDSFVELYTRQPNITASQDLILYNPSYTANPSAGGTVTPTLINYSPTTTANPNASTILSEQIIKIAPVITFSGGLAYLHYGVAHSGSFTTTTNPAFGVVSFFLFSSSPSFTTSTATVHLPAVTAMYNSQPTFSVGNVASGTAGGFLVSYVNNPTWSLTGASSSTTGSSVFGADTVTLNANTAGSALTFSYRKGFWFKNFAYTATGTVTLSANVALDVDDQTASTGNLTVTTTAAVRSAITAGTNRYFLNDTGGAQSAFAGKFTTYNNVATVLCGMTSPVASVALVTQSAATGTLTLYAVPATTTGVYVINWNAKVTRAATTSSVLGGLTITYRDPDGVVQTVSATGQLANGTVALTATTNNTTTLLLGFTITVNAKASTNIQYAFAYTSVGATAMQYNLNITVEAC